MLTKDRLNRQNRDMVASTSSRTSRGFVPIGLLAPESVLGYIGLLKLPTVYVFFLSAQAYV